MVLLESTKREYVEALAETLRLQPTPEPSDLHFKVLPLRLGRVHWDKTFDYGGMAEPCQQCVDGYPKPQYVPSENSYAGPGHVYSSNVLELHLRSYNKYQSRLSALQWEMAHEHLLTSSATKVEAEILSSTHTAPGRRASIGLLLKHSGTRGEKPTYRWFAPLQQDAGESALETWPLCQPSSFTFSNREDLFDDMSNGIVNLLSITVYHCLRNLELKMPYCLTISRGLYRAHEGQSWTVQVDITLECEAEQQIDFQELHKRTVSWIPNNGTRSHTNAWLELLEINYHRCVSNKNKVVAYTCPASYVYQMVTPDGRLSAAKRSDEDSCCSKSKTLDDDIPGRTMKIKVQTRDVASFTEEPYPRS